MIDIYANRIRNLCLSSMKRTKRKRITNVKNDETRQQRQQRKKRIKAWKKYVFEAAMKNYYENGNLLTISSTLFDI